MPAAGKPSSNTSPLSTRRFLPSPPKAHRSRSRALLVAEKAEKVFFERLEPEENRKRTGVEDRSDIPTSPRTLLPFAPESTWRHVWMLYAAGILLFITLGFSAYWVGMRRGTEVAKVSVATPKVPNQVPLQSQASLEEQLSDAAHEREIAHAQIAQRDQDLADLRRRLQQQSVEMNRMKEAQGRLESDQQNGEVGKQDLMQQRTELAQQLDVARSNSQTLQRELDSLTQQSAQDAAHAKALEAKVNDLARVLGDRETAISQQQQLLSHDRDIRELMGARDLYIAEVYDVGDNGATKKPYGRVFYTKGKSLIFYAYDLDQRDHKARHHLSSLGPAWAGSATGPQSGHFL